MHLIINGEEKKYAAPLKIASLLDAMAVDNRKVAVEVNRVIIPKFEYDSHVLNDNDIIEIIGFIGGG